MAKKLAWLTVVTLVTLLAPATQAFADTSDLPDGSVRLRCDDYTEGDPQLTEVYKTFTDPDDAPQDIKVDFYKATAGEGDHHAMVIIHGGAWKAGCRTNVNEEAVLAAGEGYLVFAIDYRLSCSSAPDPQVDALCGWTFNAPVSDAKDAITWVRANATEIAVDHGQTFSGKVAALGFSSGGNLAYMAQATGTTGATGSMPDIVAGFSGATEVGVLADGHFAWDHSSSPVDSKAARERYMGTSCTPGNPNTCPQAWYDASPYSRVGAGDARAFIANGDDELTALEEATDYRDRLMALSIGRKYCKVIAPGHAAGLIDKDCDNLAGTETVWQEMIEYFNNILG